MGEDEDEDEDVGVGVDADADVDADVVGAVDADVVGAVDAEVAAAVSSARFQFIAHMLGPDRPLFTFLTFLCVFHRAFLGRQAPTTSPRSTRLDASLNHILLC